MSSRWITCPQCGYTFALEPGASKVCPECGYHGGPVRRQSQWSAPEEPTYPQNQPRQLSGSITGAPPSQGKNSGAKERKEGPKSVLDDFKERVNEIMRPIYINGEAVQYPITTQAELRLYLARVNQVEKELRLLKAEVNNESKQIGMQYSDKTASVAPNPLLGMMFGKKNASHFSSMQRQQLRHNKHTAQEPYRRAVAAIDACIQMWEKTKIDLQQQVQHGMLYTCKHCRYQWTGPIGGKTPDACQRCGR